MYEIIQAAMSKVVSIRSTTLPSIAFAVLYEAIRTVMKIVPSVKLITAAASNVHVFLNSTNHNYKYLGYATTLQRTSSWETPTNGLCQRTPSYTHSICSLVLIAQKVPLVVAEHQVAILDCLEDADLTLKHKTLDLLHVITNARNVVTLTTKLLKSLKSTHNAKLRRLMAERIAQNALKFAPSPTWYVETIKALLVIAGADAPRQIVHDLMHFLKQGTAALRQLLFPLAVT